MKRFMTKRLLTLLLVGITAIYGVYLVTYYFNDEGAILNSHEPPAIIQTESLPSKQLSSPAPLQKENVLLTQAKSDKKSEVSYTNAEFEELTKRAWKKLPRISVVRKKNRDFHFPPPELTEVAESLGAIGDAMDFDNKLIKTGTQFLKRCAEDSDVMEAARAVCLRDLKHWSGDSIDLVDLKGIPDNIKKLSDTLSTTP